MAKLLLGKEVTAAMNEKLQARVAALKEKGVSPKLAIVRCGENPSDLSYEKGATARAELIGVEVQKFVLPEDVTKEALIAQIEAINADDSIHGCLMFRPLPKHLKADQDEICNHLAARKDVDCMTDLSNAGVFTGKKLGFAPCTPQACMEILDYYGIDCKGKNAVVIDESELSVESVSVGTHVTIQMTGEDETEEYDIVGRTEADPLNGKISDESPVGHALLNKAVGDKTEVLLPTGHTVEYTVLAITHSQG